MFTTRIVKITGVWVWLSVMGVCGVCGLILIHTQYGLNICIVVLVPDGIV